MHGARGAELARPQWVFGSRSYALDADGKIGMVSLRRGLPLFEVRELKGGKVTRFAKLQAQTARIDDPVAFASGFAALIARPAAAPAIMRMARGGLAPLSPPLPEEIAPAFISKGEVREFRRPDGQVVYAHLLRAEKRYPQRSARVRSRRRSFSCTAGPRP